MHIILSVMLFRAATPTAKPSAVSNPRGPQTLNSAAKLRSETDAHQIVKIVNQASSPQTRLFCFGGDLQPLPPSSAPHLSMGGRLDVRVALLADDVVDVVQTICRDAGEGPGAVWGKVAIGAPRASEIRRTLDDHSCRSEGLRRKKREREREKRIADFFKIICTSWPVIKPIDWK